MDSFLIFYWFVLYHIYIRLFCLVRPDDVPKSIVGALSDVSEDHDDEINLFHLLNPFFSAIILIWNVFMYKKGKATTITVVLFECQYMEISTLRMTITYSLL